MVHSDHLMLHAGSLLQADGAFLILDTCDILTTRYAHKLCCRFIRVYHTLSCHNLLQYRAPPPNRRELKRPAAAGKASCMLGQCRRHSALPFSPARQVSFSAL
jgi:hypothetical protein